MRNILATVFFFFFSLSLVSAQNAPTLRIKKDSVSYTQKEVRDFLLSGTPLARSAQENLLETINNVLKANGIKLKEELDGRYIEWIVLGHTEIQNLEIFNFLNSGRSPDSTKVVFSKKTTPYYKGPVFVFNYKHIHYRYAKGVCFNQIRGAQEKQVSVDQEVGEIKWKVATSGSSEPFRLDTLLKKKNDDGVYSKRDLERALEDTLKARDKRAADLKKVLLAQSKKRTEDSLRILAPFLRQRDSLAYVAYVLQQNDKRQPDRRNITQPQVVYVDQYGQPIQQATQRTTVVSLSLGGGQGGYYQRSNYGGGYGQYQTYPAQYGRGYDNSCYPANIGGIPTSAAFNAAANWSQRPCSWCR